MGQRPMRIREYAEYLRVLRALLAGEAVDYEFNGVRRPVKMLMHEFKYMNLEPRIPLYVSGFGPRAMGLAGEAELIDADLVRATCLTGTAEELVERIRTLDAEGLQELMFATGVDEKWRFAEEFSRLVMSRL